MTSQQLLEATSRAFYLSLRILPGGARQSMSLAYLLARCADSVSDGNWLPDCERSLALQEFGDCLKGMGRLEAWRNRVAVVDPTSGPEAALLHHLPVALQELEHLPQADQQLVIEIVTTLVEGMQVDLARFPDSQSLRSVWDQAELRRHLWAAAGCVGQFWTSISRLHEPLLAGCSGDLERLGGKLGEALQLTNVLRDLPGDLAQGRCYLPLQELLEIGLQPASLLEPACEAQARPLYHRWLRLAFEDYRDSADYILSLPWRCWRLRLAALWPWSIGVATLTKLTRGGWLSGRIKVSRSWVYALLVTSSAQVWYTPWLERTMRGQLAQLERQLDRG